MFLLDTNILSEIRKISQGRADPALAHWVQTIDFDRCHLCVITLLEIEQGILRVQHRGDEAQFLRLEKWLNDTVLPTFGTRILPIDAHTARICARLCHSPRPHLGHAQHPRFRRAASAAAEPVFRIRRGNKRK